MLPVPEDGVGGWGLGVGGWGFKCYQLVMFSNNLTGCGALSVSNMKIGDLILFDRGVIIGCGSIGKQHAKFLEKHARNLIIIDPKAKNNEDFIAPLSYKNVQFFQDLKQVNFEFNLNDVIVVSNWGPDHLQSIKSAIYKGAKKIILEKPCGDSLKDLNELKKLCFDNDIKIVVNQGWYYSELSARIKKLSAKFDLGEIVSIWITGGARCISTAGSHWISLANQIFKSNPEFIFSDGVSHAINPRSQTLSFYEGVYSFIYPDGKRLGINLTNSSAIEGRIELYWRNAIGILDNEDLEINTLQSYEINNKITLYRKPTLNLFKGPIPFFEKKPMSQLEGLYNSVINRELSEVKEDLIKHIDVSRAILLALISSELKKQLYFCDEVDSAYFNKHFMIS